MAQVTEPTCEGCELDGTLEVLPIADYYVDEGEGRGSFLCPKCVLWMEPDSTMKVLSLDM